MMNHTPDKTGWLPARSWRTLAVIWTVALAFAFHGVAVADAAEPASDSAQTAGETREEPAQNAGTAEAADAETDADADGAAESDTAQPADPEQQLLTVRRQLDAMLAGTGLLTDNQRDEVAHRLEAIADLSNFLNTLVPLQEQRLAASDVELRANYALAQRARVTNQDREAGYRVGKLRAAAVNARQLETPGAETLGDFWLMQADLFDIQYAKLTLDARQRETIRRLQRFVREHDAADDAESKDAESADADFADEAGNAEPRHDAADETRRIKQLVEEIVNPPATTEPAPNAAPEEAPDAAQVTATPAQQSREITRSMLIDVKLALLRLYDQRGMSEEVCQLVEELKAVADQDEQSDGEELRAELDRWYGYCPAIGRAFAARLPTTVEGESWSSIDQRGKVVLIHFWAQWYAPSVEAFDDLRKAHETYGPRGLSILSVDMGNADETPQVDWPITRGPVAREQLAQLMGVRTLPRYALIDAKGNVLAIAGSLTVLERVNALLEDH